MTIEKEQKALTLRGSYGLTIPESALIERGLFLAKYLGEKAYTCPILNAKFILIPAGTFMMGSAEDEPERSDDETLHQVTISKPFYLQTTPVTQGQWKKVMGNNPSLFKRGDDYPVENVSWNDGQDFINKLNRADAYYEMDLAGNTTVFNNAYLSLYEYSAKEMHGKNYRTYVDKKNAQWAFWVFHQVFKTGKPTKKFEWEIITKSGKKKQVELSVNLIRDTKEKPLGFSGIISDITERHKMEWADKYRLPTEAEWEYAARSGGKEEKWAGTSSESALGDYAWYYDNSGFSPHRVGQPHPVGQKKPNGLGLYDMTGNTLEWCADRYGADYYNNSNKSDPKGADSGERRVLRGGCYYFEAKYCRAASRKSLSPEGWDGVTGFRLAMTLLFASPKHDDLQMPARIKKVLIVDDEESFLLSIVGSLSIYKKYFNFLMALNGEEAIKILKSAPVIDLVITGLYMPKMDGFELLAFMNRNYSKVPVILMTGNSDPKNKEIAYNMGVFRYMEKPLDLNELSDNIFNGLGINPIRADST